MTHCAYASTALKQMAHSDFSDPTDGSGESESFDNLVIQAPQTMREDYIQNAVTFLSHPKVKGSPVFHRRFFLEKKGLTNEEIDEAFRRVPVRFYFSCCLLLTRDEKRLKCF